MNLSEKGWFNNLITSLFSKLKDQQGNPSEYLYKSAHHSGLIYGHPVLPKEFKSAEFLELPQSEKLKLVLLDGFIKTAVFPTNKHIPKDPDAFVHYLSDSIVDYYANVIPSKRVKDRNFWGKKLDSNDVVESLLNDRLSFDVNESSNFWTSFFNNSLLFLDVFFFGEWLKRRGEETSITEIRNHRDQVHLLILQVMASAAYADNTLQEEEKVLFNQFLASAHLPEHLEHKAAAYINHGVDLTEIDFSAAKPWLLQKYILEIAILTVWADQIVTEEEKEFISNLATRLGFTQDELEISMVAIETFVLSNWGSIPFLQSKNSFDDIRSRFLDRISKVIEKNKDKIGKEISESKQLSELLEKSATTELTDEEQIKVRAYLIEILKLLPTFVIISLPGSFLTLPLLLKILPKSVLANANKDNLV